MKIAFTVSDFGAAANIGGDVERKTATIEIPDEQIPKIVRDHLATPKWSTLSISVCVPEP